MARKLARYKACEKCGAKDGMPCLSLTSLKGRMKRRSIITKIHTGRQRWTPEEWEQATKISIEQHNKKIQAIRDALLL